MNKLKNHLNTGFSLLELLMAMTITLILLGIASTLLTAAFGIRTRESQRTDALISVQAALSLMSRDIANCGYGIKDNGIVNADSNQQKLRFRTNIKNNDSLTDDEGEDITYFHDFSSQTIIRHDRFDNPQNSTLVNRVSKLTFQYLNYSGSTSTPTISTTPTATTGRIRIIVTITLEPVQGQPNNQTITLISDICLRNSNYMLSRY